MLADVASADRAEQRIGDRMRKNVGVKATTNEKLGPIGQGEGIAAIAIAMVDMD